MSYIGFERWKAARTRRMDRGIFERRGGIVGSGKDRRAVRVS